MTAVPTWATFTLQDLLLNATDPDTGAEITVEQCDGWWNGPPMRSTTVQIPGQHGTYPTPPVNDARPITLSGKLFHPDRAVRGQYQDRFASVLADGSYGEFTGTDHDRAQRRCLVRLTDGTKVDPTGARHLEWSMALLADDPRKYGTMVSQALSLASAVDGPAGLQFDGTGGLLVPLVVLPDTSSAQTLTLTNAGTAEQWPYLQILGEAKNPRVNFSSGDELRVGPPATTGDFVVPAGGTLDFDCYWRRVVANANADADRKYAITATGSWGQIPPGGVDVSWSADAYSSDARLIVWWALDAYR